MSNLPDGQKLARFRRTEEIFSHLIELDASARASALSEACAGDAELQQAVEGLLLAHDDASKAWPALTASRPSPAGVIHCTRGTGLVHT